LWFDTGFDIGSLSNDWWDGGGYADETRVLRAGFHGFWQSAGSLSQASLKASFGLNLFGASGFSPLERSRPDARGQFTKVNLHLSRYRDLGRYFGVYAALDGQYAVDPLLLSEEFSLGGQPYGRGYDYGELTGDHGIAGLVELRAGLDPHLAPV